MSKGGWEERGWAAHIGPVDYGKNFGIKRNMMASFSMPGTEESMSSCVH